MHVQCSKLKLSKCHVFLILTSLLFMPFEGLAKEDKKEYIIQLKGHHLYQLVKQKLNDSGSVKKKNIKNKIQELSRQQDLFLDDIRQVLNRELKKQRRFKKIINAVVITATAEEINKIRSLPNVKHISQNIIHRLLGTENVTDIDTINANKVWDLIDSDGQNITGLGVTIAVIDSGIDYNHPDLGGCLGAECKVINGYDFSDDDDDPYDDSFSGHGTHIAGIIAANGFIKGVAPDAKLIAVKVCNGLGYCFSDDIIAGLEFSLDPDDDPSTLDGADIINLSLGAEGLDIALTNAINSVVDSGVVVTVAAGNDGLKYNNIGSPADAVNAITVAASDNNTSIADFSSRGMTSTIPLITKPDLSAPGVEINSTLPQGKYGLLSGTSMASPMVAGLVALIKQAKPGLSPIQIKSALMVSTTDLGADLLTQGSGLVDGYQAIQVPFDIDAPGIDFGATEFDNANFVNSKIISITNPTSSILDVKLSLSTNPHAGISFFMSETEIQLMPGQAKEINVEVIVDTEVLPVIDQAPIYSTNLNINIEGHSYNLPVKLIHRSYLDIIFKNYDANFSNLIIFDALTKHHPKIVSSEPLNNKEMRYYLAPGNYNLVDTIQYKSNDNIVETAFIHIPDINLSTAQEVTVTPALATNKIIFDVKNKDGEVLNNHTGLKPGYRKVELIISDKVSGITLLKNTLVDSKQLSENEEATFTFTSFPEGYVFDLDAYYRNDDATEFQSFSTVFEGPVLADKQVNIKATDYRTLKFEFAIPNWLDLAQVFPEDSTRWHYLNERDFTIDLPKVNEGLTLSYTGHPVIEDSSHGKEWFSIWQHLLSESVQQAYSTPEFMIDEDFKLRLYQFDSSHKEIAKLNVDYPFLWPTGKLLPFWSGEVIRKDGNAFLSYKSTNSDAYFRDSMYTYWNGDLTISTNNFVEIFKNFKTLQEGQILSDYQLPVDSEVAETNIMFESYYLDNIQSKINTKLNYDLSKEDFSPPVIKNLSIEFNGKKTSKFVQDDMGQLVIEFSESFPESQVQISTKNMSTGDWNLITSTKSGLFYNAMLNTSECGYQSLQIKVADSSGNKLTYSAEPAYSVANDNDYDCDGFLNEDDVFPLDPNEHQDSDNDGIGNNADTDDDNDGVVDEEDAFPLDPTRFKIDKSSGGTFFIYLFVLLASLITKRKIAPQLNDVEYK